MKRRRQKGRKLKMKVTNTLFERRNPESPNCQSVSIKTVDFERKSTANNLKTQHFSVEFEQRIHQQNHKHSVEHLFLLGSKEDGRKEENQQRKGEEDDEDEGGVHLGVLQY